MLAAGTGLLLVGAMFILRPRSLIHERIFKIVPTKRAKRWEHLETKIGCLMMAVGVLLILLGGVHY